MIRVPLNKFHKQLFWKIFQRFVLKFISGFLQEFHLEIFYVFSRLGFSCSLPDYLQCFSKNFSYIVLKNFPCFLKKILQSCWLIFSMSFQSNNTIQLDISPRFSSPIYSRTNLFSFSNIFLQIIKKKSGNFKTCFQDFDQAF